MTRKHRPPHTYLTDMERQQLDILVRRAAAHLGPEEHALLLRLHGRHLQDARYARDALTGVNSKLDQLRHRAQLAEKQLAAPCMEPLPEPLGIGRPLGPCVVTGPHVEHRDARGASWTLHEPCAGRPCAGTGCSHEQAGAELAELEAEIESDTVAATCGPTCSEQHTYAGSCELRPASEEPRS